MDYWGSVSKMEEILNDIKEDEKKDTKKLVIMILIIIGAFLILFLVSYFYKLNQKPPAPETKEYNSFLFTKEANLWRTQWQLGTKVYNIMMHFGPWDLENVTIAGQLDERFQRPAIYITFDPTGEDMSYIAVAAGELSLNLFKAIGKYPIAACTKNETVGCVGVPIRTCEDNANSSIIYLKSGDEKGVRLEGNCLIIEGHKEEIVRGSERVLYQWYQIMK